MVKIAFADGKFNRYTYFDEPARSTELRLAQVGSSRPPIFFDWSEAVHRRRYCSEETLDQPRDDPEAGRPSVCQGCLLFPHSEQNSTFTCELRGDTDIKA